MRLDLSFQDVAAEAAFRRQRIVLLRPSGRVIEWMRLCVCAGWLVRLALLHESAGSIASAVVACLASGIQLRMLRMEGLRLCYTAAAVCEVLIVICGCIAAPCLGWSSGGSAGSPARSLVELLLLSGPVWPLWSVARTPLPFRLLFPVLVAQSAVLVLLVPRMCASPGLQRAYAALHRGLLRTARRAHVLRGAAAATAATPAAAAASGESLCAAAYQPAFIVLGNVLVGYLAFCAELSQRRAFVRRRSSQAEASAAATGQAVLAQRRCQREWLAVGRADYWLQFGVPAACALAYLHLGML